TQCCVSTPIQNSTEITSGVKSAATRGHGAVNPIGSQAKEHIYTPSGGAPPSRDLACFWPRKNPQDRAHASDYSPAHLWSATAISHAALRLEGPYKRSRGQSRRLMLDRLERPANTKLGNTSDQKESPQT